MFYNAFSTKPLIFSIYAIIKQFLFSEKFFRPIDRLLEYAIRDEVTITNPSKYWILLELYRIQILNSSYILYFSKFHSNNKLTTGFFNYFYDYK